MSGSTPSSSGGGGGVVVGDTISFPHTTTVNDYTQTGTISFSNFETNGNEGSQGSAGGLSPSYFGMPTRVSSWSHTTTINMNDVFVVNFIPNWSTSVSGYSGWTYGNSTIHFTDGTTQNVTRGSTPVLCNKLVNKFTGTIHGGYRTQSHQFNHSSNVTRSLGNTSTDIQSEMETGTIEESNPYVENVFSQGLVSAIDINPVSPRNTVSKIKVEAWVNGSWKLIRKATGLGKIRMNLVNTNKIRATGIDSSNKRISIDRFRIYTKTTNDVYSHGHVSIDPTDDTLSHSGVVV